MVSNELSTYWRKKELERGELIPIQVVAKETGLNWETVKNLRSGDTNRLDMKVLAKICQYFGIEPGQPVPFLIVKAVED